MNSVQVFQHNQYGQIRVALSENGEPLFCLADLCKSLNIANNRNVRSRLDEGDVRQMDTPTASGVQPITFVTEPGMYTVILRSDSPKAKPMQKWVTSEVLPSIRKYGAYLSQQKIEEIMTNPDTIIQLATQLKEERSRREVIEARARQLEPKALFADAVAASDKSVLVAELAKILNQNGVNMGQNRLFQWLRENGYLCSKGDYYNQPTQKAMDLGLFEIKKTTINRPDGSIIINSTTKVSGKGQLYFVNKFLKR